MPNKNSHAQNVPQRTCVVCKTKREQASLLSFILTAQGIIFDPRREIQQRKSYVCSATPCLQGLDKWRKTNLKRRFGISGVSALFSGVKPDSVSEVSR